MPHHLGLICPPGASHVTGLTTIARELCRRGHRATVFNIADVEELARREGVGFRPLGAKEHPKGSFKRFSEKLSRMHGMSAMRFSMRVALSEISMLLEEAPGAMGEAGVTALLVDQGQPVGSTLAEVLGVPFVTICNAVPINPDPGVPPSIVSWGPASSRLGRFRNRVGYRLFDLAATPMRRKINACRRSWGQKPLRSIYDTFSPVLQLAQQTADFDFPRPSLPSHFHYIGLIRRAGFDGAAFPFERLNGRPLVYASLGTVRTDDRNIFHMLAEACAGLDVQLAITLGGKGDIAAYAGLPGKPIVVNYAPQRAVLERAALTVCHSGNNTVLESLASGVPVVAVALNGDQYGVAARLERSGAGKRMELDRLNAERLCEVVRQVLREPSYAERARALSVSVERAGGERRAADLIEQKLNKA